MVVKVGRKLGLNSIWRCIKSWRSHLYTETCKVCRQVLAFFMFIMMASIAGDSNANFFKRLLVKAVHLPWSLCFWFLSWESFCLFGFFCRDPRGFGFIQYVDPADAAEAKHHMDGFLLLGRELTVVFAEENRKKPTEMRTRDRGGRWIEILPPLSKGHRKSISLSIQPQEMTCS